MNLDDHRWSTFKGGYGTNLNVSILLKNLESANDTELINEITDDLWEELYHQEDVGLASYLALPHIVRIVEENNLANLKLLGLCTSIEQQRHSKYNPSLPKEFKIYYSSGIVRLKEVAISRLRQNLDKTSLIVLLSTIATCNGNIKLGKIILELENDDLVDEFLKQSC